MQASSIYKCSPHKCSPQMQNTARESQWMIMSMYLVNWAQTALIATSSGFICSLL